MPPSIFEASEVNAQCVRAPIKAKLLCSFYKGVHYFHSQRRTASPCTRQTLAACQAQLGTSRSLFLLEGPPLSNGFEEEMLLKILSNAVQISKHCHVYGMGTDCSEGVLFLRLGFRASAMPSLSQVSGPENSLWWCKVFSV